MKKVTNHILVVGFAILMASCGSESSNTTAETAPAPAAEESAAAPAETDSKIGVGPVKSVKLEEINPQLAETGKTEFEGKCSSCHKMDARHVGPALAEVTKRRGPEWIMNMILNPEGMTQNDPVAKELLAEYMAPMANQSLTEDQARSILEYFRQYDNK